MLNGLHKFFQFFLMEPALEMDHIGVTLKFLPFFNAVCINNAFWIIKTGKVELLVSWLLYQVLSFRMYVLCLTFRWHLFNKCTLQDFMIKVRKSFYPKTSEKFWPEWVQIHKWAAISCGKNHHSYIDKFIYKISI